VKYQNHPDIYKDDTGKQLKTWW